MFMDKFLFRVVVSQFLFSARMPRDWLRGGFIQQSDIAKRMGVRDATVSSWANRESCISAFMLFQLFQVVAELRQCQVAKVVEYFIEIYSKISRDRGNYGYS
jgi:hypothetical protein